MQDLHKSQEDFLNIVTGKSLSETGYDLYEEDYQESITGLENYVLTKKVEYKTLDDKGVKLSGRIIGGCLDTIFDLSGTKYDGINEFNEKYKEDGIIWYFDNAGQDYDNTIRVLWKLNELGYFKYTKCVIFGRFGVESSYYNYDIKNCLKDSILSLLNIPVIYDADISHKSPSLTIINGSIANIKLTKGKFFIDFELR